VEGGHCYSGRFLVYSLSAPSALLQLWLVYSGKLASVLAPMLSPNERHLLHPGIFGVVTAVLLGAVETLAAIFLFRLRTVATQLFAVALALRLALSMRDPLNRFELEGFIMTVAVLLYAIRLKRRGVLS
jgi:hypothetical protein